MKIDFELFKSIEAAVSDSFYIVDFTAFQKNLEDLSGAFRRLYPRTRLAYSYKTNYLPEFCRLANALGYYSEVVSGLEYAMALKLGVAPRDIIFNGPIKYSTELLDAIKAGAKVNLDSVGELDHLIELAKNNPDEMFKAGLRVNFDLGDSSRSRFGFPVDEPEFADVLRKVRAVENIQIAGLHCHYSNRTLESFEKRIRGIIEIARFIFEGSHPAYLDIGGGFCGKMSDELKKQLKYRAPSFQEYADVVASAMDQEYSDANVELIIEPGMSVTGDTMVFAAKVIEIKQIGRKMVAVTTASMFNVRPFLTMVNIPFKVYSHGDRDDDGTAIYDIAGYTCSESDILHRDYLGNIEIGDYLIFENVGAYGFVLTPHFIRASAAIVCLGEATENFWVVKRTGNLEDFLSSFNLDFLRNINPRLVKT